MRHTRALAGAIAAAALGRHHMGAPPIAQDRAPDLEAEQNEARHRLWMLEQEIAQDKAKAAIEAARERRERRNAKRAENARKSRKVSP